MAHRCELVMHACVKLHILQCCMHALHVNVLILKRIKGIASQNALNMRAPENAHAAPWNIKHAASLKLLQAREGAPAGRWCSLRKPRRIFQARLMICSWHTMHIAHMHASNKRAHVDDSSMLQVKVAARPIFTSRLAMFAWFNPKCISLRCKPIMLQ